MLITSYWYFAIPGIILAIYAQIKLSSTYAKYIQIGTQANLTGAEAARRILDSNGLDYMPVEEVAGRLTDHFDPEKKALFLSSDNFHGRSIAAVGVAAHEAGHALQQKAAYALFDVRMMLVPAFQFATQASGIIFFLGYIMHSLRFMLPIAIAVFAVISLFQVVTLPVEFDASSRAKKQLVKLGLVTANEAPGVSKVLNAAAMTYVAAMIGALLNLLEFVMEANRERR